MTVDDAEQVLVESQLIPCIQVPLIEAKELRDACLAADIPVVLDRGACCGQGGCGCAPRIQLLARAGDAPRVARLMHDRWREMARREGTVSDADATAAVAHSPGEDPCPACGAATPLVQGACADCGLRLE